MNRLIPFLLMLLILVVVGISGCIGEQTLTENDSYKVNSSIDSYFDSVDEKNNSEVGDNITFASGSMNVSAKLINESYAQANVTRTIDIYKITSKDVQDLNDQTTENGTTVTTNWYANKLWNSLSGQFSRNMAIYTGKKQ